MERKYLKEYQFIQEKIKRKPIDKKKAFRNVVFTIILAILFGAVASGVFVFLQPRLEEWAEEMDKESLSLEIPTENRENASVEEAETGDYQGLSGLEIINASVQSLAEGAEKFLVDVTGVTSEMDWFDEVYGTANQCTGIIISISQEQVLILTNHEPLEEVYSITVTFGDGVMVRGEEIRYDTVTNLSVVRVPVEGLPATTLAEIKEAPFGSADTMVPGEFVLAVGAPLGYSGGVVYGHLTTKTTFPSVDHVLDLLLTDVVASTKGTGVLLNTEGQIIGLISQDRADESTRNLIAATSIDSLQAVIEKLMNDSQVGYVGIEGVTVTADIASLQFVGKGIYVTKIKRGSSAMEAGIHSGDIIYKVNTHELDTIDEFHKEILSRDIGETVEIYLLRMGKDEYKEMVFDVKLGGY